MKNEILFNPNRQFQKMINFASLFSQFRNTSNSAVSDLLEQPNIDLQRLLDQDSFVNEYKSGNNKLIDFMKYDKFETLVEYITVVGPAEDRRRSYKFPLSASDILSAENNSAADFFFPDGQLYVDQVTYQEVEVDVEIDEEPTVIEEDKSEKKEDQKPAEQPQTTIIQDNIDGAQAEGVQEVAKDKPDPTEGEETKVEETEEKEPKEKDTEKDVESSPQQEEEEEVKKVEEIPKKKVIVKQKKTVEKINKKPVEPLIGNLYSYFSGEVNYTLAGYVSKVLTNLLTKKSSAMMKYVLTPQNRQNLLKHVESRSVAEFIVKVLTFETIEFMPERTEYFKEIIAKLGVDAQIFMLSNLSACVSETVEKIMLNLKSNSAIKEFSGLFLAPQHIASIINNVMSQHENVSVYNAPILFTYLTNVPLNAPENEQLMSNFQKILSGFIDKSCEKLQVTKSQRKALGFGRLKILEIITFILKENILEGRDTIAEKPIFFTILFELCRNYDMNNVLHNEVVKILEICLSLPADSAILKTLIEDNLLLNFLVKEYKEDMLIKAGEGDRKNRKGFIGHIVQICQKIKEYAEKNQLLSRMTDKEEFLAVMENLVEKETFQNNKNLAGYSMRKGLPQKILFQKEDVISEYITFLSKSPAPVFETEPDPINIEHPDLIEQLQKQLEENLQIKDEEKPTTDQEHANHKYWIKHMDYDLNDLMDDL